MPNPQIEEPKSSVNGYELPCGYIDAEGTLHTSVEVREITGEEEEILAAKNMPVMKKLNRVLSRCTTAIGPYSGGAIEGIIPDLVQGDRVYLLFAIRRASLGDEMPFVAKCPSCEQESMLTLDLSDLEVKKMSDPMIRAYDVELPKSKKKVHMRVLIGRGEEATYKAMQSGKDVVSHVILSRVEAIENHPVTLQELKELGLEDRNYLRSVWEDHEGGIETDFDIECPQCEHEYSVSINPGDGGFFNPLEVLKTWKKRSSS